MFVIFSTQHSFLCRIIFKSLLKIVMDSIESQFSTLTNEAYLSARAKMLLASGLDPLGARAWLTTAKMMFPDNFEIQYESYVLEKNEKKPNIKKAAKLFASLFEKFGVEGNIKGKKNTDSDILWKEIDEMAFLLRSPGQENAFLCRVFDAMPRQSRKKILIECAVRRSEIPKEDSGHLERIRILMLAFNRFPDLIKSHGAECLEYIIEECKNSQHSRIESDTVVKDIDIKSINEQDSLLALLVYEICPLLLNSQNGLNLETDVLFDILTLTVQFVLNRVAEAQNTVGIKGAQSKTNGRRAIPWTIILETLEEIGRLMVWQLTRNLSQLGNSLHDQEVADQLWQRILTFHQQTLPQATSGPNVSKDHLNELFYTETFLFLKHLSEYVSISTNSNIIETPSFSGGKGFKKTKPSYYKEEAILVEGFVSHIDDSSRNSMQHPLKRRRTTDEERKYPLVTHGGINPDRYEDNKDTACLNTDLVRSFKLTIKYYELLKSDSNLNARLQEILQPRKNSKIEVAITNHQATLTSFYADYHLYQGQFREALQYLRQIPAPIRSPRSDMGGVDDKYMSARRCRLHIKMASVNFCLGDYQNVADQIIQAVSCLQQNYIKDSNRFYDESAQIPENKTDRERIESRLGGNFKQATVRLRHVHFLSFSRQSILSYCCRLLVHILKDRSLTADIGNTTNDFAIGHVIVLLQYCYPEEKDLLELLLHRIRLKDTFSYPIFCSYVVHIEFLEEFAHIVNTTSTKAGAAPMGSSPGGQGVILDICPPDLNKSTDTIGSSRRLGTRGANKGEKMEVRAALKRQVARSYENLDVLIADFLTNNRDSIYQCLL